MDERDQMAWLARRVGFGVGPGQLDEWVELGADAVLDLLTTPDASGVPAVEDPFAELERTITDNGPNLRETISAWFGHVIAAERPLQTWMQWFWHDFFAVSAAVVRQPGLVHDHFNLMFDQGMYAQFLEQYGADCHNLPADAERRIAEARKHLARNT